MAQAAIPVKGTSQLHLGWLGLGAIVIAVALGAGLIGYYAGTRQPVAGIADQALMDQSTAVWNGTYDPAKVGAVYASDAAFVDNIEGETSTGLSAILAKINDCLTSSQFTVKAASAPVQYGDTVVSIVNYGTGGTTTDTALAVIKVKDGKIIRHTVYPLP